MKLHTRENLSLAVALLAAIPAVRLYAQLPVTPSWITEGNVTYASYGWKVASAGDINGDGFDDVVVAADRANNYRGQIAIARGSRAGLERVPTVIKGPQTQVESYFGSSVASAGDVNRDGYDDVIVGAPRYVSNPSAPKQYGAALLYYGSASGLSPTPTWIVGPPPRNGYFGYAVTSGDVNGDGYSDVLIGAYQQDLAGTLGATANGRVYIYFGASSGISTNISGTLDNGTLARRFGCAVATANLNGDAYADVIVGDHWQEDVFAYAGSPTGVGRDPVLHVMRFGSLVSFGTSVGAGDFDGNGLDDVVVGASGHDEPPNTDTGRIEVFFTFGQSPSSAPGWTMNGEGASDWFGLSCGSAGDVNRDGKDDLIVGAYSANVGGKAYVYFGQESGLPMIPDWTYTCDQAGTALGYSVAGAGDINRDGLADVIVGAWAYSNGESMEGRAYAFYAPPPPPPRGMSLMIR